MAHFKEKRIRSTQCHQTSVRVRSCLQNAPVQTIPSSHTGTMAAAAERPRTLMES